MSFRDYQKEVDEWARNYWPILEQLCRLTEEVGEVAREVNHLYGTKKRKPDEPLGDLGSELCDVIFTAICMANREKIDLQAVWEKMMAEKMRGRDAHRFDSK